MDLTDPVSVVALFLCLLYWPSPAPVKIRNAVAEIAPDPWRVKVEVTLPIVGRQKIAIVAGHPPVHDLALVPVLDQV